jgi:hypothetical protein
MYQKNKDKRSIQSDSDDHPSIQKESSTKQNIRRFSFEQKPYNHDILVIQTEPPKVNNR